MINYFYKQYKKLKTDLDYLNQKLAACDICFGSGRINKDKVKVKQFSFDLPEICECQIYTDDYSRFDVDQKIREIKNMAALCQIKIPDEYHAADPDLIDTRLKKFIDGELIFCWIWGDASRGKTFSLHSMRLQEILKGKDFDIIKEFEIDHNTPQKYRYKTVAIDDLIMDGNDGRNAALLNYLYQLIDLKRENHTKLIITANHEIDWYFDNVFNKINPGVTARILARMQPKTLVVKIEGENRRV